MTNDIHLGISYNDPIWLEQAKRLFSCIIDECHKRDIYELYILGDFFHDRKNIGMKCLDTALDIADMLKDNNIHVVYVIGNHDVFYKTKIDITSLRIFEKYDNMDIIYEPTIVDNVGLVSWSVETPLEADYLFGHLEINGFPIVKGKMFDKSIYNIQDFSQYKHVYSGHFHTPSQRNNITYLGAPYHMTFNDVDSIRGFYFFDDGNLEFIEFDGVKFVYVSSEEEPDDRKIKGNIVKLIFEKDYGTDGNTKKIENVQKFNPLRFHTDFTKLSNNIITEENEEKIETIKSNKDILFDFIDVTKHPDYINLKKMRNIVNTLLED